MDNQFDKEDIQNLKNGPIVSVMGLFYMKKTLILNLRKEWYCKIKLREKNEEYRRITKYWTSRFIFFEDKYDKVEFCCGYPKKGDKERRMTFNNPKLRTGIGDKSMGAPKEVCYIITWDDK